MLVTAKGEWVFEDSAEFLAALGDSNPDYDAASFAVKNLGFIKFQILDDSIIEIELHPRNVELPALLAVQQQLLSSRVNLFRINISRLPGARRSPLRRSGRYLSLLNCARRYLQHRRAGASSPSLETFRNWRRTRIIPFLRWSTNGECLSASSIPRSSPSRSSNNSCRA